MSKRDAVGAFRGSQPSVNRPVKFRLLAEQGNIASYEMNVDYQRAGVPERFYYADYCDVRRARFGFALLFGKLISGTSRLLTKIEIGFPEQLFVKQLWGNTIEFQKTLAVIAEKIPMTPLEIVEDTEKIQTFRANNVFMAMSDEEAVMDYYYLSPRDIHFARTQRKDELGLEPVIRVLMSTGLMIEFFERCKEYVESMSAIQVQKTGVI